jgi:hypothetical protein
MARSLLPVAADGESEEDAGLRYAVNTRPEQETGAGISATFSQRRRMR